MIGLRNIQSVQHLLISSVSDSVNTMKQHFNIMRKKWHGELQSMAGGTEITNQNYCLYISFFCL